MSNSKRGLSTLVEVLNRGKIYNISESEIRNNTYIITFIDGSQANVNGRTYKELIK